MRFVMFKVSFWPAFEYSFRLHLILSSSNEDITNPRNVTQAHY